MGASSLALPPLSSLGRASAAVLSCSAWHLFLDTGTARWAVAGQVSAGAPDICVTRQHSSSPWILSAHADPQVLVWRQCMHMQQVLSRSTLSRYAGCWAGMLCCVRHRMGDQAAHSLLCRRTRIPAHRRISPCLHLPQRQPLRLTWHQVTQRAIFCRRKTFRHFLCHLNHLDV